MVIFDLYVFFPVTLLHEEKVLLEILIHFVVRCVGQTLFYNTPHGEVGVKELIEWLLFLQVFFYILLNMLIVLLKFLYWGLNLLYYVDWKVSSQKALHTLVHKFQNNLERVIDLLGNFKQILVVLNS